MSIRCCESGVGEGAQQSDSRPNNCAEGGAPPPQDAVRRAGDVCREPGACVASHSGAGIVVFTLRATGGHPKGHKMGRILVRGW